LHVRPERLSIVDGQEGVSTPSMEYDGIDRLKHVVAPSLWGDAWYGYDALDNLVSTQLTAGGTARTTTHTFDPATNRLTTVSNSAGSAYNYGYQYDVQGNIVLRGSQGYTFDMANRMTSATGKGTYAYDGLGRRVSVVGTDGVNRIQVYSQEGQLLYATASGAPLAAGIKYVYLDRHVIAEVGGGVQYDHTDGLGSPVVLTDAALGVISRTRYEPYGVTAAGPTPALGFGGHVNAADLGLVYMQQRYYDPVAGRFLSIDPVTTDANTGTSFNRYAYANNSPYNFIDPDGRDPAGIAALAKSYNGDWGCGKPGWRGGLGWVTEFKCNLFVNRIVTQAGDIPPMVNNRGATAGELADKNSIIANWVVVTDGSVKDGDIVAIGHDGDGYSGHTGIVVNNDGQPTQCQLIAIPGR
jgi:RHS repeat-associated protein